MDKNNIEKYNIYIKIIMLTYIILSTINSVNKYYLVLFSLVFIILNISYLIFNTKSLLVVSSIISFVIGYTDMPLLFILYALNSIEVLVDRKYAKYLLMITLIIPVLFLKDESLKYILLTTISYMYIHLYNQFIKTTNKLCEDIENKRKMIYRLTNSIEEVEQYTQQSIQTIKLEERNMLSHSIHDKVGHTIAGSLMQLEASKIVMDKDNDKAKSMIDNTIKVLRVGMDDIRKILREINPPEEQIGINKIKLILEEKTKNTQFNFNVLHIGDLNKISKKQWMSMGEIVREVSTNSFKYSKGNKISVNINVLNKVIKVEVKDNGVGSKNIKKGIGLNSIEQKIIELDGKLIVDGSDGFSVVCLLPIDNEYN